MPELDDRTHRSGPHDTFRSYLKGATTNAEEQLPNGWCLIRRRSCACRVACFEQRQQFRVIRIPVRNYSTAEMTVDAGKCLQPGSQRRWPRLCQGLMDFAFSPIERADNELFWYAVRESSRHGTLIMREHRNVEGRHLLMKRSSIILCLLGNCSLAIAQSGGAAGGASVGGATSTQSSTSAGSAGINSGARGQGRTGSNMGDAPSRQSPSSPGRLQPNQA
jgi:hypothetical protein